jgi:hypothetical protein
VTGAGAGAGAIAGAASVERGQAGRAGLGADRIAFQRVCGALEHEAQGE